ncbi:MAG TPA: hypothetical protein VGI00_10175 [Streptosporangiaceae bacterium]
MWQLARHRLARLDLPERLGRHPGRHLDQPPVRIEEPESVATTRAAQRTGFGRDAHPVRAQRPGQAVHRGPVAGAERDQVGAPLAGPADPDHERLGAAHRAQVNHVAVPADLVQAPDALVESDRGGQVLGGQGHVADMGDGGAAGHLRGGHRRGRDRGRQRRPGPGRGRDGGVQRRPVERGRGHGNSTLVDT